MSAQSREISEYFICFETYLSPVIVITPSGTTLYLSLREVSDKVIGTEMPNIITITVLEGKPKKKPVPTVKISKSILHIITLHQTSLAIDFSTR